MKLLHLVLDDKFTHAAFENFNKQSGVENTWLVVTSKELRFVSGEYFEKISPKDTELDSFSRYLSSFDFIIVHSLSEVHCKVIINNPHQYVWVGMGYDYYEYVNPDIYVGYSAKVNALEEFLKKSLRLLFKNIKFDYPSKQLKGCAISEITYFAPVLPNEFDLVKSKFNHLKYIEWNYGTVSKSLNDDLALKGGAGSILLGNSSDSSNNHVEVLDLLSSIAGFDRSIVLPLNYGSKIYKKLLSYKLKKYAELNINVLNDFMPKEDYFSLISNCDVVIMNHIRQQAGANIAVGLFVGAKVFLNAKSPFYEYYRSKGVTLFTTDEISKAPELLTGKLASELVKRNRDIILSIGSQDNTDRKTAGLIDSLRSQ